MDTARRMSVKELLGRSIHNLHGDKLGDLADIVLDRHAGMPIYGVLSMGGVLGMGEKLFAVPWSALRMETEGEHGHRFLLDASVDRLKGAPGFDRDNWPDEADMGFIERTHTNYT